MRGLILLGCVLFVSACDVLAPAHATTVRIVNITMPVANDDAVLLRIQNFGPAGSFQAVGYEETIDAGHTRDEADHVRYSAVCSQLPAPIEANTTINSVIPGCGMHTVDYVVIHSSGADGRGSATTACYNVGVRSCPWAFEQDR